MKRILYILTILVLFLVQTSLAFAQDVEDILRSLESPDVDYHVDEAIKTIIPQKVLPVYRPSPANKKIDNFKAPEPITKPLKKQGITEKENTSTTASTSAKASCTSVSHTTSSSNTKTSQKPDNPSKAKSISSKPEENTLKPLVTTKTPKSELANNKKNDKKDKDNNTNQNKLENKPAAIKTEKNTTEFKPIKIWSLYNNIMTLKFVKELISYSHNVPKAIPAFAKDVFVFWQNKSQNTPSTNLKEDEAAEENDSDDDGEENEEEEEEEEEEEDTPKDLSVYDNLIAQAKELYENQKWEEIRKLFEDNPDAGERLDSYKYQLEAELNSKSPNYNLIRSFANGVIEDSPDDAAANYGLALSFINRKKPDLIKASEYINICLKKTPAYPGAKALYNQILIKRFLLYIVIGIVILIITIIAVIKIILSKKKRKKEEAKETTSEKNEEKATEPQAEKEKETDSASAPKTEATEASQDNSEDTPKSTEAPNKLKQKFLAITNKFAPISEKLKPVLAKSKEIISKVFSKIKKKPDVVELKETAPQQSNDEEKIDEIERVIVEVDENGNEISETTIVEVPSDEKNTDENEIEVIEELIEEPEPEEEIVEEIIEEEIVEDNDNSSGEDEFEEEIIEEIIEEV